MKLQKMNKKQFLRKFGVSKQIQDKNIFKVYIYIYHEYMKCNKMLYLLAFTCFLFHVYNYVMLVVFAVFANKVKISHLI